jgi:4-amino-4-deoxy-L-arabinose transferase-like glycosyltransferase
MRSRASSSWAAAALLAAFVFLWRLGVASWNRDEYVYASAGRRWLAGHADYNLEHPPLAKYLVGAGQVIAGHGPAGARLAAVAAAVGTGIVLALIARRLLGGSAALVAFVLWVVLPKPTAGLRVDRLAMLDVFAAAFAALALLLALRWAERPGRGIAALTGVAIGCAGASKVPGALVLVPVAAYVLLETRAIAQVVVAAVAAVGTFLLSYAPLDVSVTTALRTMWDFQRHESAVGFPLRVAGHVYTHPPWWTPLRLAWDASPTLTAALVVAATVGAVAVGRSIALLLVGAAVVPLVAVMVGHGRYLEHYAYAWTPPLILLAALGAVAVWRRNRLAAAVIVAPLVVAGAVSVWSIASLRTADYALAGQQLARTGARAVLVAGPRTAFLGYACPGVRVVQVRDGEAAPPFDAVIVDPVAVGTEILRWPPTELASHPERFRLLAADRLQVWVRRGVGPASGCGR